MTETTLHIKNMVCNRCIKVVKEEIEKLGLTVMKVILGQVLISSENKQIPFEKIEKVLNENGFELIDDKNAKLIEKIKVLIINKIHHSNNDLEKFNFSGFLSKETGLNYSRLSSLFSSMEGTTIEKFIIHQKIEKVKELLAYNELTLSEISYRLGYSSVQHLSNQFKQITGLNPSFFKQLKVQKRTPIDLIK